MSLPLPASFPPGFVIDGRYEVVGRLGTGGTADVYQVVDARRNGHPGALKFLKHPNPTAPWVEAAILTGITGQFVLPVQNASHDLGYPFIVTDLAPRGSVGARIHPGGVLLTSAAAWTQQACRGIARINDSGLVHRDIKPANLFLDVHDQVLVGDLGEASLLDPTGHAGFVGTPETMAPEVAIVGATIPSPACFAQNPCSVLSDIYSLGATLYWMLAGKPAHQDPAGSVETMQAVATTPPPDLLDAAPHIPIGVRDIVRKAMAANPVDRYQSVAELDAALGDRRSQPERGWVRVAPHPTHADCFEGSDGRRAAISVCAAPTDLGSRHEVQITQSGRRLGMPWAVVGQTADIVRGVQAALGTGHGMGTGCPECLPGR